MAPLARGFGADGVGQVKAVLSGGNQRGNSRLPVIG